MEPSEIKGPDKAMREKLERIEEKQARGEKLTPAEKGVKGAAGSMERGASEEKQAARAGRLGEYREEHRTASWMKGEETRAPAVSEETQREVERIRAKQERGETLTRHESGVLGGTSRAKEQD